MREIYLDNNATTAPAPEVVEAMLPWLGRSAANPSSLHRPGEAAAGVLAAARVAVARLVGAASPREIVFTSGGTEANNAAVHTALAGAAARGRRCVLTSTVEHESLRRPLEEEARRAGLAVDRVGVDGRGAIAVPEILAGIAARGRELALVSILWANNETGVHLADEELAAIAALCRRHGIPCHVDAVQVPGKLPMDLARLGVDLASLSAHKFHGPQGVGALYVRAGYEAAEGFVPRIAGGAQEEDRRAGTPNVPGIAGFGKAAELASARLAAGEAIPRLRERRDRLEEGLCRAVPGARVLGAGALRLPNTANVLFPGVDGEVLLAALAAEGVAVSAGAACSSGRRGPSRVLLALGLDEAAARSALRFSLSVHTSAEEVEAAVALVGDLAGSLARLRG
ncbi:MAG: cysteine desulfurase family protein [Planctomycetota bacterium]